MKNTALLTTLFLGVALFLPETATADRLQVDPEASLWAHAGAAILLFLHIGAGAVGLVAGVTAILARKGHNTHRTAGRTFLIAMFIAYVVAIGVAPFMHIGQRPNLVGGTLALYMLLTGVSAARRREFIAGRAEYVSLFVALSIFALGILFMIMGANSESGTVDGSPPEAFYIFAFFGLAGAAGDLRAILKRSLTAAARIMRHLWRMCASLFFASSSFFLGQPQVFPDWFNASVIPFALGFAPLIVMVAWLIKLRSSFAKMGFSGP